MRWSLNLSRIKGKFSQRDGQHVEIQLSTVQLTVRILTFVTFY